MVVVVGGEVSLSSHQPSFIKLDLVHLDIPLGFRVRRERPIELWDENPLSDP